MPPPQPIPALLQSLEKRMGLGRAEEACAHATSALGVLATAVDGACPPALADRLVSAACMLGPMLCMLRGALCQLALEYLGAHKATAKLSYVSASLFAGLVQEGFCMPEGQPEGGWVGCRVCSLLGITCGGNKNSSGCILQHLCPFML